MMKLFLLDRLITIGFLCIIFIFTLIYFILIDLPSVTIVSVAFVFLALCIGWLVGSFFMMKRKVIRIRQLVQQIEQPYLVGEVLPKPSSLLEQQYFEVMRIVSQDAISNIERVDKEAREYKEFIEQWIHELKTPLTAMSLILANDEDLRKLRRELKRLDNLTDQVLHFARLQSIEKDKQFTPFSTARLLHQTVKNQMDLLIAAKIQVVIEGDTTIYNDQKALQFIVNQFLINSVKYCPNSKILMRNVENTFIFEDNGIGIPKHELPRIFERGYTGTNGRKLGTSTGMGLYIVSNMCAELHIQLSVDSEIGQFTRFTLIFPPNLTKM